MHQGTLTIKQVSDTSAEATLDGFWTIESKIPPLEQLIAEFRPDASFVLSFKAGSRFRWDSRLLAWLMACQNALGYGRCQFDLSDLPRDIADLFQLANAVPPNKILPEKQFSLSRLINQWVSSIGDSIIDFLAFLGELAITLVRWLIGKGSARWMDIVSFCHQTGPAAIPIVTLQSVLVGMILAYLGVVQLRQFGAEIYVSDLVGVGMVREMGALMTAIIMSGRTGAAYAAQLGTMQVNEEIDALTTLGIKPMDYLVLPRTLALLLTMPLLTLYSNILGMVGGGLVATSMDVTWVMYLHQLREAITYTDITTGVIKSFVFALLIAMAGCRAGLACGRSSAAVGQATTNAVVTAIIYLVVADAGLNILYFKLGV